MKFKRNSMIFYPECRGNVLFIILMAVILFAGLTYAVGQGSSSISADIDEETSTVSASDLVRYAKQLEQAVQLLRQYGVGESDISFAHPDLSGTYGTYGTNPSQEVFNPRGGGISYRSFPSVSSNDWIFTGANMVINVGATNETNTIASCSTSGECADLVALLEDVPLRACNAVNDLVGIEPITADTPPTDSGTYDTTLFAGSFSEISLIGDSDGSDQDLWGKRTGCFNDGSGDYHVYHVLLKR